MPKYLPLVEPTFVDSPEHLQLKKSLGCSSNEALGIALRIWLWCSVHGMRDTESRDAGGRRFLLMKDHLELWLNEQGIAFDIIGIMFRAATEEILELDEEFAWMHEDE